MSIAAQNTVTPSGQYSLELVAVGANRQANSGSWGHNGLVSYAASKFVAVYDPIGQQLLGTLPGHTDKVTSAQWIPSCEPNANWNAPEVELVSTSVDKTLIVWKTTVEALRRPLRFQTVATLRGHESGITAVAIHVHQPSGRLLLASVSTDGTLIVWKREKIGAGFEVLQVLKFGSKLIESVAFSHVPGVASPNVAFLACGAVDNLVHLFASDSASGKFSKLTTLAGHESWIRSLAFAEFESKTSGSKYLLLASASQDRRVRLWKFEETGASNRDPSPSAASPASTTDPNTLGKKQRFDPAVLLAQLEANEEGQLEIEQHSVVVTLPSSSSPPSAPTEGAPAAVPSRWGIQLESVILGHDDWVLSAKWIPPILGRDGVSKVQLPRLLTASMDKTMVVWTPDEVTGLWVEATRVGEVGGNHLGFFGGLYSAAPRESILAIGYNGAFHLWLRHSSATASSIRASGAPEGDKSVSSAVSTLLDADSGIEEWKPEVSISGHFSDVKDVSWDPSGSYLLSVSKDQTARIWARWAHKEQYLMDSLGMLKVPLPNSAKRFNWHELARPQVHGHDLSNAVFQSGVGHRFISCAEEKVLRVFDGPVSFLRSMANLSEGVVVTGEDLSNRAASANVPALGLSNKPVFERVLSAATAAAAAVSSSSSSATGPAATTTGEPGTIPVSAGDSGKNEAEKLYEQIHPSGGYGDFDLNDGKDGHVPLVLSGTPPFEEQLLQRTLWPEVAKLYGHGNELVTVASSRKGDIIASACACKVQTQDQAGLRIWDTTLWKQTCELAGPTLTVTQMQFSHCDRYLLATSRDRGVFLFQRNAEPSSRTLSIAQAIPKAHLRVVWSCSWTWDDKFVATGSRDKLLKIWRFANAQLEEICSIKFKHAVTAVAWAPIKDSKDYWIAVGLESGEIEIWKSDFAAATPSMTLWLALHLQDVHVDSIKKMVWNPRGNTDYALATGSSDQSVRIFSISLPSQ